MAWDAYERIFERFTPVDESAWKARIEKDLKGKPYADLITASREGIDILPVYTADTTQHTRLTIPPRTRPGWDIVDRIVVKDVTVANASALKSLAEGASAIRFELQGKSLKEEDITTLIQGIILEAAPVVFESYHPDNKNTLEAIVPASCPAQIVIAPQDSLTAELVMALEQARYIDAPTLSVEFTTSENYFFEIARLRAFRWLWQQYSTLTSQSAELYLFSVTQVHEYADHADAYTNMIRNTTQAMSAVMGGCDGLLVTAHDTPEQASDFGRRIARNVQHLLQLEAHIDQLTDVSKGAYYIEYLTYYLARNAWEKFRLS